MHEMAVTQSVLEIAIRHAAGAIRITRLNLVIGELSGVIGESVQFYWDILAKGTIAEGSSLHFDRIKTRFRCHDCNREYEPTSRAFECPGCGSRQVTIVAGREFRLESIEVD